MHLQPFDLGPGGQNDGQDESAIPYLFFDDAAFSWLPSPPLAPLGDPQAGMMDTDLGDLPLEKWIFPTASHSANTYAFIHAGPESWESAVNACFSGIPNPPRPGPAAPVVPAFPAFPGVLASVGATYLGYRAPNNVGGTRLPSPVRSSSIL